MCGDIPLAIFGVDHFFSCGAPHLVGSLHIHPWSRLHASYGSLQILGWLLWSIHLGGLLYCFFTHILEGTLSELF
jgi:hypothetical protein